MSEPQVISPSKASFSRRTKKTVPKPAVDHTPSPRPRLRHRNVEEEEMKEGRMKKTGFQLAFGVADVDNVELNADRMEVTCLHDTDEEEGDMLLESSDNYRRLK